MVRTLFHLNLYKCIKILKNCQYNLDVATLLALRLNALTGVHAVHASKLTT